jgi:hypothetical protein
MLRYSERQLQDIKLASTVRTVGTGGQSEPSLYPHPYGTLLVLWDVARVGDAEVQCTVDTTVSIITDP